MNQDLMSKVFVEVHRTRVIDVDKETVTWFLISQLNSFVFISFLKYRDSLPVFFLWKFHLEIVSKFMSHFTCKTTGTNIRMINVIKFVYTPFVFHRFVVHFIPNSFIIYGLNMNFWKCISFRELEMKKYLFPYPWLLAVDMIISANEILRI